MLAPQEGESVMSIAQDFINVISGFNTTEMDRFGNIISHPVRPVVYSLSVGNAHRERNITNLHQLKELMKIGPVQLCWQYDGIAVILHCLSKMDGEHKALLQIQENRKKFSLGMVTVTLTESLEVPKEVIEQIVWLAPRINAVAAAAR